MQKQQPLHTNSKTSQQKNIIRQGIQHGKAPWEARRDVNLETTDDIIDHRVSQNVKYNNDKKSRPENFPARPLLMTFCQF